MSYNIRKLHPLDYYKGFLEILKQLTVVGDINFENFLKRYNQIEINPNHYYFVIEENEKILGSGAIIIENKFVHNCGNIGHIEDIVIDKNQRGNGLGKLLIEYLINIAKNNQCYKVILDCHEKNKKFYEKCGFINKNIEMCKYFT